ncbi:MAG: threonylcarbamoyl-AMP synthase [Ruminococcaceae bacterium]|nr:threonylcarbamoyl-AMP synthase [Oscillospiraceae bacterium]
MKTQIIRYTNKASLEPAAAILRDGGIVAFPTETVYGLGGNAFDPAAAKKIYEAKGRPSDNPLIVHLHDYRTAGQYAHTTPLFFELAEAFMPGPLTIILRKRSFIPDSVTGGLDTVGLRVPSHPIARELIELAGVPVAAPSANLSGKPSPTAFSHVMHDLNGRVDAIIDGGTSEFGVESTIIKLENDGTIKLLRPGAITIEMLSLFSDHIEVDPAVTQKFDGIPLAPGMKYRHYAPSSPLTVLEGDNDAVYEFLNGKERCGVICFDEDLPFIRGKHVYTCGPREDSLTQAKRLFDCLRRLDDVEGIDVIFARMPAKVGIGLAVFNRLLKAAGFSVRTLPPKR